MQRSCDERSIDCLQIINSKLKANGLLHAKDYLATKRTSRSDRLFPIQRDEVVELWKAAREKTGIDITPQKLRQWFCSEMLRLGVSETYVDAFCGRVPKSVLARHYTDFSPQKLEISEKANIEVLA